MRCTERSRSPLELGGADGIANLRPQPYEPRPAAHEKDWLENYLHRQVCNGKIQPVDAQQEISKDWFAAYLKYADRNSSVAQN